MLIDDYELTRQIEQMKDVNRDDVIALIARQKPVDAVPVVRCVDCKHFDGCFCGLFDCVEELGSIAYDSSEDDFCSRGERRIKDETD